MFNFLSIRRVRDGAPVRLHPTWQSSQAIDISPQRVENLLEVRASLPPSLRALPLRIPVSPASLAAYSEAGNRRSLALNEIEFGLVPWSGWGGPTIKKAFNCLHNVGATFTLLEFGVGYSSLGPISNLPIHKVEIAAHFFETDASNFDADLRPILSAITDLLKALRIAASARLRPSEAALAVLTEYAIPEFLDLSGTKEVVLTPARNDA